jgi:predicted ATPase
MFQVAKYYYVYIYGYSSIFLHQTSWYNTPMIDRAEPRTYVLSGACATGKTTLLEHYKKSAIPSLTTVDEAARRFFMQNSIPDTERGLLRTQKSIQDFYIETFENARTSNTSEIILFDSSALSSVAYATRSNEPNGAILLERIKDTWLPKVTKFLLLDAKDIQYEYDAKDPVRQESSEERQQVQDILLHLLVETGAPFEVISGTVEERIAQIDKTLFLN